MTKPSATKSKPRKQHSPAFRDEALIHGEHFASREIMRATVFNYIECDYNRWRRHSACGGLSPEQFENQNLA